MYVYIYIYIYMYVRRVEFASSQSSSSYALTRALPRLGSFTVATFYPFSHFCEIGISLLSQ